MEDIRSFLLDKNKSWDEGIKLLKKYSDNEKETNFLSNISEVEPMHEKMMHKRLENIFRIYKQNKKKVTTQTPAIETEPIHLKKLHFSKAPSKLTRTKELTNRLLSRDWQELDEKEQDYFKNDIELFESKKALLHKNSAIESELKSLHASVEHIDVDSERKEVAESLVILKKEQNDNWAKIDNFNTIKEVKDKGKPLGEAESIKKRNSLRSRISKLKKQVFGEPEHKNHTQRVEKLNKAKEELKGIEEKFS